MALDFTNGNLDWGNLEKNLGANINDKKKDFKDDRFWKLSRDENDNGGAIIRLLPDPSGVPFIQIYKHTFQSFDAVNKKKRWYVANSPQTVGHDCPASDLWSAIFNEGSEEGKLEAKNFSRKIQFHANIKVIKDPANPENNGKNFVWQFGTKLKDKFMAALQPSENDIAMGETPKQLFNPLTGCNIKLKIQKGAGFLNYDATTIENESAIYDSPEEAKADILENSYLLEEFNSPEAFDTYDELLKRLKWVLECYDPKNLTPERFKEVTDPILNKEEAQEPQKQEVKKEIPKEEPKQESKPAEVTTVSDSTEPKDEDESLSFLDDL